MSIDDGFYDELTAATKEVTDRYLDIEKIQKVLLVLNNLSSNDPAIRAVRAAYNALEDYYFLSKNEIMNDEIIEEIRINLFSIRGLKPEHYTGGIKNSDLMTYAYYVLFIVSMINNRNNSATRYILRMFSLSPRIARKDLVPKIYDTFFKHRLEDVYKLQLQLIMDKPKVINQELSSFYILEKYVIQTASQIEAFEVQIDKKCKEIADEALGVLSDFSLYFLSDF